MRGLLDSEVLEGAHEARIVYRPTRLGVPAFDGPVNVLIDSIEYSCQVWGGAGYPFVPLLNDLTVKPEYLERLPGSAIDGIVGFHPFDLFDLDGAKATIGDPEQRRFGSQLAVALLEFHNAERYKLLEVVDLAFEDPWRGIYAACLGTMPTSPDPGLLKSGELVPTLKFEDFLRVERVQATGSLDDLIHRLNATERMTPRAAVGRFVPPGPV